MPIAQNVMTFDQFKDSLKNQPGVVNEKAVVKDVMSIIGSMEWANGNI